MSGRSACAIRLFNCIEAVVEFVVVPGELTLEVGRGSSVLSEAVAEASTISSDVDELKAVALSEEIDDTGMSVAVVFRADADALLTEDNVMPTSVEAGVVLAEMLEVITLDADRLPATFAMHA